ncbi:MAG: 1-deoxy-D-xylulose-5-phosphate reductoisomerase [Nitrospinae bacterium]|nr:1-deoxy-D-xylulose-5-phosphate reductoisomerase [Nitrospinota bacterium]
MKNIAILGSSGSIGRSTLDIVRAHPDKFRVIGLAVQKNVKLLEEQIEEFRPEIVAVHDVQAAKALKQKIGRGKVKVLSGVEGTTEVATHAKVDMVVAAIVGAAGMLPTLRAIQSRKKIALANKETLVMAGEIMMAEAEKNKVKLLPVDSEHSAIFQSLEGNKKAHHIKKLILTASGGPFREKTMKELGKVTLKEALHHPNWDMGPKITIDSSTLMNKGLEVIEARWLFDVPPEQIEVVVHPQSIIHSMVEFIDTSVIAQIGVPDMRVPISYALHYPHRLKNDFPSLDFFEKSTWTFHKPDIERFPCLRLAFEALKTGGTMTAALNSANEVAVQAFLDGRIRYLQIPRIIEEVLGRHVPRHGCGIDEILKVDEETRRKTEEII